MTPLNGRRIPELHQPSSRSRDTAARTVASASTGRGQSQKSAGRGALGRLSSPFLSISFQCSASDDGPAMGSKRAIGRPRSVINTSSPAFTWRRYALNDVLSPDTVAISITLACLVKAIWLLESSEIAKDNPRSLTKVWPHGDYPLIDVGVMELNRNPENYFADLLFRRDVGQQEEVCDGQTGQECRIDHVCSNPRRPVSVKGTRPRNVDTTRRSVLQSRPGRSLLTSFGSGLRWAHEQT